MFFNNKKIQNIIIKRIIVEVVIKLYITWYCKLISYNKIVLSSFYLRIIEALDND